MKFSRAAIPDLPERRLPPCGGSGLKCRSVVGYTLSARGLPPCGGSGLKFSRQDLLQLAIDVSLRVEGVD